MTHALHGEGEQPVRTVAAIEGINVMSCKYKRRQGCWLMPVHGSGAATLGHWGVSCSLEVPVDLISD